MTIYAAHLFDRGILNEVFYVAMKDTIESIRKSTYHFFSGTLLSRISGMARDMSMAYAFGADPAVAAFMVAFRFAHLLRRLFGEGALQSAFIPAYENLKHQDHQRALDFFRHLSRFLSLFLIGLIAVGLVTLLVVVKWFDFHTSWKDILILTTIMLPSLMFICLFGLNASFLQCEKNYFIPAVAPVAFNVIWIAATLWLQYLPVSEAMPWLGLSVVIACFFQWVCTCPKTWSYFKEKPSLSSFSYASVELKKLFKPLLLGIIGVSATQINTALDALFANFASPQGPAFLWYAMRLEQLPLALFGIAIAGAVLPPLSRALKANDTEKFHHFLHDAFLRTWNFMLFLTAILFLMGDCGVNILYKRGEFTHDAMVQTTMCLWGYGIGLLPSALILVLAPACYAQNNYFFPSLASFIALILNGVLNAWFIFYLSWGAESIACATSISAIVNCVFLCVVLCKHKTPVFTPQVLSQMFLSAVCTVFAASFLVWFRFVILQFPFFSSSLMELSFIEQFIFLIFQFSFFAASFFLVKRSLGRFGLKFNLS